MTTKDELNGQTEKDRILRETVIGINISKIDSHHDFRKSLYKAMEAYYKYRINVISDEMIDKIIEDGIWGFPEDKAGYFMVKQLKDFAKNIISKLNE